MVARICWGCGVHAQMHGLGTASRRDDPWSKWSIPLTCGHCGEINVAHANSRYDDSENAYAEFLAESGSQAAWFPKQLDAPTFDDTPDEISESAREAYVAKSNEAYRAAILMARAVLEAICKDHGGTEGRLVEKIDAMRGAGHITNSLSAAAHAVRDLGNDMAHGDFVKTTPTEDEASAVLAIMRQLIEQLYEQDARTARLVNRQATSSTP